MKILILSMTVGEGHNYAARAMKEYFAAAGAECEVMDTYGYVSPAIAQSLNKGYLWAFSRNLTIAAAIFGANRSSP